MVGVSPRHGMPRCLVSCLARAFRDFLQVMRASHTHHRTESLSIRARGLPLPCLAPLVLSVHSGQQAKKARHGSRRRGQKSTRGLP